MNTPARNGIAPRLIATVAVAAAFMTPMTGLLVVGSDTAQADRPCVPGVERPGVEPRPCTQDTPLSLPPCDWLAQNARLTSPDPFVNCTPAPGEVAPPRGAHGANPDVLLPTCVALEQLGRRQTPMPGVNCYNPTLAPAPPEQ